MLIHDCVGLVKEHFGGLSFCLVLLLCVSVRMCGGAFEGLRFRNCSSSFSVCAFFSVLLRIFPCVDLWCCVFPLEKFLPILELVKKFSQGLFPQFGVEFGIGESGKISGEDDQDSQISVLHGT